MMPVFVTAPLLPALLTCAGAWAIAVWALKQHDSLTRLVQAVTGSGESVEAGDCPDAIPFKKSRS